MTKTEWDNPMTKMQVKLKKAEVICNKKIKNALMHPVISYIPNKQTSRLRYIAEGGTARARTKKLFYETENLARNKYVSLIEKHNKISACLSELHKRAKEIKWCRNLLNTNLEGYQKIINGLHPKQCKKMLDKLNSECSKMCSYCFKAKINSKAKFIVSRPFSFI